MSWDETRPLAAAPRGGTGLPHQCGQVTRRFFVQSEPHAVGSELTAKVVVIGDTSVGKTCLLVRFCRGTFSENYKATIGVDFMAQRFRVGATPFCLHLWDTAGQEQFRSISQAYYRGATGIVVCYDVSNPISLENVKAWVQDASRHVDQANCPLFLLGLKSDLYHAVTDEEGEALAMSLDAEHWKVSSKLGDNVNDFFDRVAVVLLDRKIAELERAGDEAAQETPTIGDLATAHGGSGASAAAGAAGAAGPGRKRAMSSACCRTG